jgi:hypothetical protein
MKREDQELITKNINFFVAMVFLGVICLFAAKTLMPGFYTPLALLTFGTVIRYIAITLCGVMGGVCVMGGMTGIAGYVRIYLSEKRSEKKGHVRGKNSKRTRRDQS